MTLTTDKGKTFEVNWAWAPVGEDEDLAFELADDKRELSQIAADFEGCARIHRESENEMPESIDYDGYKRIRSIVRYKRGRVQVTLMREA